MHNLSPIKKSQKNNSYFDMTLQTKNGTYRSVCFSPEKHSSLSSNYESSSPVKISKFQLKRNKRSNDNEIHINKRSKFEEPQESEVTFDIEKVQSEEKCKPGITAVSDVFQGDSNAVINVCGRITIHGAQETILSKGKTLRKQEAVFTDNSGTMRLVLWESDITRVVSKAVYNISKIVVREFDNAKYLTLNKQSIIKPADTIIEREDTEADGLPHSLKVDCPAEGVLSVQRFLSCKNCQTKLVPDPTKNLVKCTECGIAQLKSKSVQRLMANVMFAKADSTVSLHLFDDKLKQLHNIYQPKPTQTKPLKVLMTMQLWSFSLLYKHQYSTMRKKMYCL